MFLKTSYFNWVEKQIVLREKYPYSEFFWSVFPRIQTEYGEIHSVFSPNAGKYGPGKLQILTLFKQCFLFAISIWQVIGTVHVVYVSWLPWRHESLLHFGIGGPMLFPRDTATMILKRFAKLGILVYLRIL